MSLGIRDTNTSFDQSPREVGGGGQKSARQCRSPVACIARCSPGEAVGGLVQEAGSAHLIVEYADERPMAAIERPSAHAFLQAERQVLARIGEGGFVGPRGRCAVASPREPIREGTITGCRTGLMLSTGAA